MFVSVHHICLHLDIYSYSCVNNTSDDHASICNRPHSRDQSLTKNSNHRFLQRISSQYKKKPNRTRKLLYSTGAKSGVSKMSSHVLTDSSTWNVNDSPVDKSAICLSTCLSVRLSVCLPVNLSLCPSAPLSVFHFISLSLFLSVFLCLLSVSFSLFLCLSPSLPVFLSVTPYLSLSFPHLDLAK